MMSSVYDPILGLLRQPDVTMSPTSGVCQRLWPASAPLDISPQSPNDAHLLFGSPFFSNKTTDISLETFNDDQRPYDNLLQSNGNCEQAPPLFDNFASTINCAHLDDFSFDHSSLFNALHSDWPDHFTNLRDGDFGGWSYVVSSPSDAGSGAVAGSDSFCSYPPATNRPRHSSSSCSEPEDLAALVEVVDWALSSPESVDEPGRSPPLYKDQQQVLDEIYRECENGRLCSSAGPPIQQPAPTTADSRFSAEEEEKEEGYFFDDEEGEAGDCEEGFSGSRKRSQNRKAASRYRDKRRRQSRLIKAERERLEQRHKLLLAEVNDAQREIDYLKAFLSEIRQKVANSAV